MKNMIDASKSSGFFDGYLVARFFDHANQPAVPSGIAANLTRIRFGKIKTLFAQMDSFVQFF